LWWVKYYFSVASFPSFQAVFDIALLSGIAEAGAPARMGPKLLVGAGAPCRVRCVRVGFFMVGIIQLSGESPRGSEEKPRLREERRKTSLGTGPVRTAAAELLTNS
jgi:hypothetical protein